MAEFTKNASVHIKAKKSEASYRLPIFHHNPKTEE